MKIALFGATGLVGRSILDRLIDREWSVTAISRRADTLLPRVFLQASSIDLDKPDAIAELSGIDAVIWATGNSGKIAGDVARFGRTLDWITKAGVRRLILIGSLSVLDYTAAVEGSVLDENSPTESNFPSRDGYARIKRAEEELACRWASERGGGLTILRMGAVIGPGHVWTARLGFRLGTRWVQVAGDGHLPVVHVHDAAAAVANVLADPHAPSLLHIIHGQPCCRNDYVQDIVAAGLLRRPWCVISGKRLRRIVSAAGRLTPISSGRFDARFKAVRFSGMAARPYLPATSMQPLAELAERCRN